MDKMILKQIILEKMCFWLRIVSRTMTCVFLGLIYPASPKTSRFQHLRMWWGAQQLLARAMSETLGYMEQPNLGPSRHPWGFGGKLC